MILIIVIRGKYILHTAISLPIATHFPWINEHKGCTRSLRFYARIRRLRFGQTLDFGIIPHSHLSIETSVRVIFVRPNYKNNSESLLEDDLLSLLFYIVKYSTIERDNQFLLSNNKFDCRKV